MIIISNDHAGVNLKEAIKAHLSEKGIEVLDLGTHADAPVDYPNKATEACQMIADGKCEMGILVCGTGIGMSMAANKTHGIRAAVCGDYFSAKATRLHNNANVLCLGERVIGEGLALELVDVFLSTKFEGGRHQRRVDLLTELDKNY